MRYRLGIGLEWKKIWKSLKLPCLINAMKIILNGFFKYKRYELFFQWLSILSYAQNSGWLWYAVTSKWFEIQTWDWSSLKENSKIFKIIQTKKFLTMLSIYSSNQWRGASFFIIRVVGLFLMRIRTSVTRPRWLVMAGVACLRQKTHVLKRSLLVTSGGNMKVYKHNFQGFFFIFFHLFTSLYLVSEE